MTTQTMAVSHPLTQTRGRAVPARPTRRSGKAERTPAWRYAVGCLMACALIAALIGQVYRPSAPAVEGYIAVAVGESGTLWEIAAEHPVPGLPTADTVALIRAANGLDSDVIHDGQVLRVPAPAAVDRAAVASR